MMTAYREWRYNKVFNYDKREPFILKDGGTIHIDYKGESFKDGKLDSSGGGDGQLKHAPLVFLVNGLT